LDTFVIVYENFITKGEGGTFFTPEELADVTGLTTDAVNEAAVQLRHIKLLDENDKIQKNGCQKEYCVLYSKNLFFCTRNSPFGLHSYIRHDVYHIDVS